MSVKQGDVVTHAIATEWGVGKVVEATIDRVSILFNDGTTRKIACSHFDDLVPAAHSSYHPVVPEVAPLVAAKKGVKAVSKGRKSKQ
ncbi:DUF3553 domain-containing protein [Geomonas sp. Red32]|uniref:DUF3553 domain-containing protein n=1 Tax=Geomonas sp. Red32 TaxID=2912856 RepID=UPI00202CA8E3|nr:DUF3553 domain-containing protein [Geomonas sp. Red32]MCM0082613.1 DUF3553 domain-containing protein [Geomonas sp. Red32]